MSNELNGLREFGGFRLDADTRVLWHGREPVGLPLKEVELLCALTESAGRVITKDELLTRVWPDSFVEESNLSRHVYVLRKALKEYGAEGLIETVPRRGYRFTGEVTSFKGDVVVERHSVTRTLVEEAPAEEQARAVRSKWRQWSAIAALAMMVTMAGGFAWWRAAGAGAASATGVRSIAVLPFRDIEGTGDSAGLGLADLLITQLGGVRGVTVRPTSAVGAFDGGDPVQFGARLDVDAVLEGSIYRAGDRVRVTARLLRTGDGSVLWSGHFERARADELRMQDEIALKVVDALALNLNPGAQDKAAPRYTADQEAHRLYVEARRNWNKRNWQAMLDAEKLFREAIRKDPSFALAYAGLADTLAMRPFSAEAENAAAKALELEPELAEAHATRGFIQTFKHWKWREAEASFKRSIELNTNYATAHHWYSQLLAIEGRYPEAKAALHRALEIDPTSYNFLADLGQVHYFDREYDKAREYCLKALEINPNFTFAHQYLHAIYLQTGEHGEAVESWVRGSRTFLTLDNESEERRRLYEQGFEQMRRNLREGGIKQHALGLVSTQQDAGVHYINATRYAAAGENGKALDSLERAFEGRGFSTVFVKADPVFDPLRGDERYKTIIRRMGL